jgi:hypothetical protein
MIVDHYPAHPIATALTQFPRQTHPNTNLTTSDPTLPSARRLFVNRCCALMLLIGLNVTTYIAIRFITALV